MLQHTPWGTPQQQQELTPGITWISTSSHGGYHLSADLVQELPVGLRDTTPFAGGDGVGGRYYEEDEDWCIIALAFPHLFSPYEVYLALRTFEDATQSRARYSPAKENFHGPARQRVQKIADRWYEEHREHWERLSYGTGPASHPHHVRAFFRHISSNRYADRLVPRDEFHDLPQVVPVLPGIEA